MSVAILNDVSRCVGCGACALACKESNGLPGSPGETLDAYTWTVVERRKRAFVRRMCMHCQSPACASVCPVAALHKTPEGPVAYDAGRCIGCRYCIMACPFGMPKYQWDKQLPITQKCVMCYDRRVSRGLNPACTEVCPARASVFGQRDALIAEARQRIEQNPGRYVNHIYGVREAGGTSVLYLSHVPFEELGFAVDMMAEPYPDLTWAVLRHLPKVAGLGGALLFGTAWVINRRMDLARQAAVEAAQAAGEEEPEA